ncbi:50S ribosomal protein L11 methyltransferase [Vineibacter terrae]|uniref:50S ribosomal protein L11 methyltransferase n=1 Tax=Vineibacter terrae TaxID=2586908 RepID=UPI002E32DA87|nr:50S ribosomal protein L11 methyltransferase [Vineibacter terrae]HEX2890180.1 50S ribosomal protein L11 methyltransferase [Vineibacter terrae]
MTAWKVSAVVPASAVARFDAALSDILVDDTLVVSTVETSRDGPWRSEVFGAGDLDAALRDRLAAAIAAAAHAAGIAPPPHAVEMLPETDWVAENQRSFQPFAVGPFWVHPSHEPGQPPTGAIPLRIDAGLAFGTGTHATTRGCLEAIAALDPACGRRAIDVGCGSGILAIAMAKLWRRPILGSDNDPEAVAVARENAELNSAADLCMFHVAEGLESPVLTDASPFDLIVANILAQPLIDLAPAFARAAAPGATLILAGLLAEQEDEVCAAYAPLGFPRIARVEHETGGAAWPTLTLRRGG